MGGFLDSREPAHQQYEEQQKKPKQKWTVHQLRRPAQTKMHQYRRGKEKA